MPSRTWSNAATRADTLALFRRAEYGLFMHYGLYSLLGRGEWVQFNERIPIKEYEKLAEKFTAERFDAEAITKLAMDAGMGYINITTRHHDGFCLWNTKETSFNSVNSPARRDLIDELANACARRNLGLFLYYSHGRDWRHPYFPPNSVLTNNARPHYPDPEPSYLWRRDEDTRIYIDFMHAQLKELLTQYGSVAGIWFDGRVTCKARPDLFRVEDTYKYIRSLRPSALISYKGGVTGTEDFIAPERDRIPGRDMDELPGELCDTLNPEKWGYVESDDMSKRTADDVLSMLAHARSINCNLLLNTGLLGDGSVHPKERAVLLEAGKRMGEIKLDNSKYGRPMVQTRAPMGPDQSDRD